MFKTLRSLKIGDVIVGIEGTQVKGITSIVNTLYRFDGAHEYANVFSYGAKWIDWHQISPDFTPQAPAQSVLGIAHIRNDRQEILDIWETFSSKA